MSHLAKEICCGKTCRSATDNSDLLASGNVCFRNGYLICCHLIYGIFFQTADVDGIINQVSAAALLTGMLADHRTCGRKRIIFTDQVDRACIIFISNQCDIARDIYMCRTHIDTWNFLSHFSRTFVFFNMADILIMECFKTLKHFNSGLVANGTVRCIFDHSSQLFHLLISFHSGIAIQDVLQQCLQLWQSVTTWNTFSACLVFGRL